MCHTHKEIMDIVDVQKQMKEFVLAKDSRAAVFGHIGTLYLKAILI
jgi:hypothetical protein